MKKKILIILCFILFIPLLSCKSNEPILIGFSNELSGSQNTLGVDAMYGALLAVEYINENGGINGRPIKLLIEDDYGDKDKAVEADNKLIEQGCVAIIGHGISKLAEATVNNANEKNYLLISPTISTTALDAIDDNFFRLISSSSVVGYELSQLVKEKAVSEEILIVYSFNNKEYSTSIMNSFLEDYGDVNQNNIMSFNPNGLSGYDDAISFISGNNIENVLLLGSSFDVAVIVQGISPHNKNIFLPIWPTTNDIFHLAGSTINGAHGINNYNFNSTNEFFLSIKEIYFDTYGIEMSFSSMYGFEAALMLAETLKVAKDFSTSTLKETILSIGTFDGIMDSYVINQYGDCERELYWFMLDDYEFIEVSK